MKLLTERQAIVLTAIADFIRERGMAPTLREIGAATDIRSSNGVDCHLHALECKGYLKPRPITTSGFRITRGIQLSKKARAMFGRRTSEDRLEEIRGMFKSGFINISSEAHAARFADLLGEP